MKALEGLLSLSEDTEGEKTKTNSEFWNKEAFSDKIQTSSCFFGSKTKYESEKLTLTFHWAALKQCSDLLYLTQTENFYRFIPFKDLPQESGGKGMFKSK